MSKQKEVPSQSPPLTPEQQYQQMFSQLSTQYKTPLRTMLSETEEAVQNTISQLIQQLIQINNTLKQSNQENTRLQKLCTDNNINFNLHSPNRSERRAGERKQAKIESEQVQK